MKIVFIFRFYISVLSEMGQNDKIIWESSNYLTYFFKKKILGGAKAPLSSRGSATAHNKVGDMLSIPNKTVSNFFTFPFFFTWE